MGRPAENWPGSYPEHNWEADLAEAEEELARYRRPQSGGKLVFDFVFGLVCPGLLLVADPGIFTSELGTSAVFAPYLAQPTHVLAGILGVALALWLVTGARHPVLGLVLVGLFVVGLIVSLVLAFGLLRFAVVHALFVSGVLALTPWLTAFVFLRNTLRAIRAGAQVSGVLTALSLLVVAAAALLIFGAIGKRRAERARTVEAMFLSDDADDHERAVSIILDTWLVDFDRIAHAYMAMGEDDPRRKRVADSYYALTGQPIENAVERLRGESATSTPLDAPPLPEETLPPDAAGPRDPNLPWHEPAPEPAP
jgi:hypothetical protein